MIVGEIIRGVGGRRGVGRRLSRTESSARYFTGREVSSTPTEDLCKIFVLDPSKRDMARKELSARIDSSEIIQLEIRRWVRQDPKKLAIALV